MSYCFKNCDGQSWAFVGVDGTLRIEMWSYFGRIVVTILGVLKDFGYDPWVY